MYKIDSSVFLNNKKQIQNDDIMQKIMDFIAPLEGCKLESYKCSAGVWTIGYGHTDGVTQGMKITQKQAETYFRSDIKRFLFAVKKEVGEICTQNQIVALTSFAFNVGLGVTLQRQEELKKQGQKVKIGFLNSRLLKTIKANPKDFNEIEKQFMSWIYIDRKPSNGLANRREIEVKKYKTA